MQVTFSAVQPYTPEWNGNRDLPEAEQVKTELSMLDLGSLLRILDALTKLGIDGKVDTNNIEMDKMRPVISEFAELLPTHVVKLTGLTNKAGAEVTVQDVIKYPTFLTLALELLMQLVQISSPTEEDTKNLSEPSA